MAQSILMAFLIRIILIRKVFFQFFSIFYLKHLNRHRRVFCKRMRPFFCLFFFFFKTENELSLNITVILQYNRFVAISLTYIYKLDIKMYYLPSTVGKTITNILTINKEKVHSKYRVSLSQNDNMNKLIELFHISSLR